MFIILWMNEQQRKPDRRASRTKTAIRKHLVSLILEKHYDLITVQDIIERADVGRSTFYLHFRDKEDVLFSDWKRFLEFFFKHVSWENLQQGQLLPVRELFHHLKEYYGFYRALERSQKSERLFRTGQRYLEESFERELISRFDADSVSVPLRVSATYLAREIFGQMRWWLDASMPNSPDDMDRIFHELVMPGLRNSLNVNSN
ncbi:MAG: TetR/AcrR family transcriptional regulator [Pyrinomonadaceae bacterium]|jgi:AcrR family transcriptional regulator